MDVARTAAWQGLLAGTVLLLALAMPTPTSAQPTTLAFDEARSSARFIVRLRWRLRTEGHVPRVGGELQGDSAQGWTVRVDVDGRSLKVSGPRWMSRMTRSDDFLAVDSHPEIRFQSDRFSDALLRAGGEVSGQLSLRGLTRPVSFLLLPSACAHPGRDCDLQVNGILSRKAFGMTSYPSSVKDDVELQMRVRLKPPGSGP